MKTRLLLSLPLLAPALALAQNVGINQPTPQATLHVGGSTSTVRVDGLTGSGQRVLTAAPDGTFGTQAQPTLGVSGQTLTLTSGGSTSSVTLPTNTGPQGPTGATGPQGPQGPQGANGAIARYGDGSAGSLTVSGVADLSQTQTNYNFQYTSITVNAGATLVVPSGMILRATGNVIINGTVTVLNGAQTSASASAGVAAAAAGSPNGGIGLNVTQAAMLPLGVLGGGSGARAAAVTTGSAGGGQLTILSAGIFTLGASGTINANGQTGVAATSGTVGGSGGGGGGVVTIAAKTSLTVNGVILANGGAGANGVNTTANTSPGGGGGGGGIVHFLAPSISIGGSVQVNGGTVGSASGSGTLVGSNGGGASGGNGGNGANTSGTVTPSNGSNGYILSSTTVSPENLLN